MYDELVKALRDMSKMGMKYGMAVVKMREAADAIEELNCNYQLALGSMKKEYKRANEAEKQKPRWIPVTERLPSKGANVLVLEFGRVEQAYTTTYTADGSLCWVVINGGSYHRISDADCPIKWWMPLPKSPKEEKIS